MFELYQSRTRSLERYVFGGIAPGGIIKNSRAETRRRGGTTALSKAGNLDIGVGIAKSRLRRNQHIGCRCCFTIENRHGREMPRETVHFTGTGLSCVAARSLTQRENTTVPYFISAFNGNNNSNNVNNAATSSRTPAVDLSDFG